MLAASAAWTTIIGTVLWVLVKTTIRSEIADAENRIVTKINGSYVRSQGSPLTGHEIQQRLNRLEKVKE